MSRADDPLSYYQNELTDLRAAGAEFARRYPRVARRLELGADESPDPHVERLIESFAFLTSRIQRQLDDEFPDAAAALLGVLYPHYTAPVPSTTVVRFDVRELQGKLTTRHLVERHTRLIGRTAEDLTCRFRTCYPVTLWPIEITEAAIESRDRTGMPPGTRAILRIRLRGWGDPDVRPESIRFYLNGELRSAAALYESLFSHAIGVFVRKTGDGRLIPLPQGSLRPVGFGRDEAVLPAAEYAHAGYRLLQEYFADPRKFLFADLADPGPVLHGEWEVVVALRQQPPDWLRVTPDSLALGCTPVVNLFDRLSEPIRIDHRRSEYRLVPDVRRMRTTEVHSISKISSSSDPKKDTPAYRPLYSFSHGEQTRAYWHSRRVPAPYGDLAGTDVLLSFVDLDFNPAVPEDRTVWAHTLCTNRRLAERLQPGRSLQIEEAAPVSGIHVLYPPTPQREPPLSGATMWRLVSQLSLNHLSLDGPAGVHALQEILRLYGAVGNPASEHQALGVVDVRCRPVVRRAGEGPWRGMCRGTEVTLTFDEHAFSGSSPFILASVLRHFLGLYASINSFTQTIARGKRDDAEWKKWPPLTGEQTVL